MLSPCHRPWLQLGRCSQEPFLHSGVEASAPRRGAARRAPRPAQLQQVPALLPLGGQPGGAGLHRDWRPDLGSEPQNGHRKSPAGPAGVWCTRRGESDGISVGVLRDCVRLRKICGWLHKRKSITSVPHTWQLQFVLRALHG